MFCAKCGAQLADGSVYCAYCGAQQPSPNQQNRQNQQTPNQQNQPNQQNGQGSNQQSAFSGIFDTPDHTAQMHPNDIEQNKAMGILAYIGPLVLIPIFAAPQSKYARFHANQALIPDIALVILSILSSVLLPFVPPLGIIFLLLNLAILGILILGIVNAASGKAKELPFLGNVEIIK